MWKRWLFGIVLFFSGLAHADTCAFPLLSQDRQVWLGNEVRFSLEKIFHNMSAGMPGSIVAAQTRTKPNYYFHWVRDAGLVVDALITHYQTVLNEDDRRTIWAKLLAYSDFSRRLQEVITLSGLGEPKFNIDGTGFYERWGRPQNDGPAIRATSIIHIARLAIKEKQTELVHSYFYPMIKRDLDYTAKHWHDPSYDLWEEVKGDHFYNRMVQRRALLEGAALATDLGDTATAAAYLEQAKAVEQSISSFWNPERGHFVTTLNRVEGIDEKNSQLDIAFVLGLLHGSLNDGFLPFTDPHVLATIDKLLAAFAFYPVNQQSHVPGLAIGRYPEDRFAGPDMSGGNPWVLATLAMAEVHFHMAREYAGKGLIELSRAAISKGEGFVARVQYHAHLDGSLNEQINRDSGYMTSVEDLTWNYAAILTTAAAAKRAGD